MDKSEEAGHSDGEKRTSTGGPVPDFAIVTMDGEVVNASGHPDQLKRHFSALAICGMALTVDNAWVVLGLSLSISISWFPRV